MDKKLPAATTGANTTAELPEMKDFIKSARVVQIECFQINPALAGVANGTGGIVVAPGGGPFNISWNGGQINDLQCDGTIKITGLAAGNYIITVSNGSGVVGTCAFSITVGTSADCSIFEDPACRQAIVEMISAEAFSAPPDCRQWEGDPCSHDGNIYRLGNVGIGTDKMRSGYSIAVKDGILTDKFRVELCETSGWCDYVFDPGYPLPGLYELEQYLNVYRHLPGSISQDECRKMAVLKCAASRLINRKKKIEEGYLYLIELNNKKKELQKKLTAYYEQN
ncbi:MAG: hypothetical protein IPJ82_07580 [Lewinellaceae bacterium]|nr:hypothetical protein [Lewinellaceae bacterium]